MAKVVLKVEGMACEVCAGSVADALSKVSGVADVSVDLKKGAVSVTHDGSVKDEDLVRTVVEAGFKAKVKRGLFG
ncbi:MAG: heavy-metal-associated domain-containing protein [Candidatus Methanoplasma sp.]|jgi:copper chaperone CopZ|nr:heavy-metal-associated domain-containing protein [Candidatus Methanoplasma sp.]